MTEQISCGGLTFRLTAEENLELIDSARNERLWIFPGARIFLPQFAADARLARVERRTDALVLDFAADTLTAGRVTLTAVEPGFKINAECTPNRAVELNRLDLAPAGSLCNCYEVRNFRNQHTTDRMWPEVILGSRFATDTYSTDWQFAPHPTAMMFVRNDLHLLLGATGVPVGGYGLYLRGARCRADEFYLHYGDAPWGMKLAAGEIWHAPEFRLFAQRTADTFGAWAGFGELLIREKYIANPAAKRRFDWHRNHVYCTWNDQCYLAEYQPDIDLKKQSAEGSQVVSRTYLPLTDRMVRDTAALIRREKLPFDTILIDGGWTSHCGDFNADPVRFPNFRKLVDDLHADGFKVVVWWSWAEIRDAEGRRAVGEDHLILNGKLNRHHRVMCDYSKESTQREYLIPTFRRMFSAEPGCYNLDGIKTDYQADKVHFDLPAENPAWRGEENYMRHLYELFHTEMRRHKPDAMHIGCAGNYFLAEFMETNRTYDVGSENHREHVNRAKMLAATAPGVLPAFDMTPFRDNRADYLQAAREMGLPVHIGTLHLIRNDRFSPVEPMNADDYALFRKLL